MDSQTSALLMALKQLHSLVSLGEYRDCAEEIGGLEDYAKAMNKAADVIEVVTHEPETSGTVYYRGGRGVAGKVSKR